MLGDVEVGQRRRHLQQAQQVKGSVQGPHLALGSDDHNGLVRHLRGPDHIPFAAKRREHRVEIQRANRR